MLDMKRDTDNDAEIVKELKRLKFGVGIPWKEYTIQGPYPEFLALTGSPWFLPRTVG